MVDELHCRAAKENALSFLKAEARFPNMIFSNSWERYLFFESDLLFGERFIAAKDALLSVGASAVIGQFIAKRKMTLPSWQSKIHFLRSFSIK